jgi:uncharacterized OsmC-like protein
VGKEEGVLVIRRVHVDYRLVSDGAHRETIARVHDMHHDYCPVYRSLKAAIEITTSYELGSEKAD